MAPRNASKQAPEIEHMMSHDLNMGDSARNPYLVYHEDGLLDICLGLALLMFGVVLVANYPAFSGLILALLYPMLMAAKQDITAPRIRPADLPPAQVAGRMKAMSITLGVSLVIGVLLFALSMGNLPLWLGSWLDRYLMTAILVAVAGLFVMWGLQSGAKRLFIYAGLILVACVSSFWLDITFPQYAIALGVIISLIGLVVTARFMRDHPKRV
jgi:hypothetical protein